MRQYLIIYIQNQHLILVVAQFPFPHKNCKEVDLTASPCIGQKYVFQNLIISHSRGCFCPSRTIILTFYELVPPGRPLGALRPMLAGRGPSSPTQTAPHKPKTPIISE